jgi:hypothetical protein
MAAPDRILNMDANELDGLADALHTITPALRKKIITPVIQKHAEVVRDKAADLAPVRTGALSNAMRVMPITAGSNAMKKKGHIMRRVWLPYRWMLGIPADSPWYYPAFVEYKHKSFLRAAVEQLRPQFVSSLLATGPKIEAEAKRLIEQKAKRAARKAAKG